MRIDAAVAENQFELESFDVALRSVAIGMARNEIGERPFAGGDDSFDRINLRNCRERSRTWTDQIADLRYSRWPAMPSIGAMIFV